TDVNGTLFFTAQDGANGWELWKTDGTAAGTTLIKDIYPGGYSSFPSNLTNVNGTLFFTADGGINREGLWRSDAPAAGTVLVSSAYTITLINVNGTLFFTASDINGEELWKSDGTEAGTVLVKDIFPGGSWDYTYYGNFYTPNSSNPSNLTNVNGTLFFPARTAPTASQ